AFAGRRFFVQPHFVPHVYERAGLARHLSSRRPSARASAIAKLVCGIARPERAQVQPDTLSISSSFGASSRRTHIARRLCFRQLPRPAESRSKSSFDRASLSTPLRAMTVADFFPSSGIPVL